MILVGGLTPAWQQILTFDGVLLDQVNRAQSAIWCGSGKVLNVARGLHHLGSHAGTVCPIGGLAGRAIREEFDHDRVPVDWIRTATPTRICTTLIDQRHDQITELVENAAALSDDDLDSCRKQFLRRNVQSDVIVLSGSLPIGTSSDFYSDLIAGSDAKVILDARGPELMACLAHRPLLIKPNREELQNTIGGSLLTRDEIVNAMRELVGRGARWVLMTDGVAPAWLVSESEAFRLSIPVVASVNPIGSGDAVTAGIADRLDAGEDVFDAVRFGLACGTANAEMLLPARFDRSRVEELISQIRSEPA